ncbi:hypothetical protein CFELI_14010 [Corynebacterium felinum]|uniref:Uncharacterized protein n=1 Tax=Corynebacterium felinum TaxID=131318 RepID=A0ABU2B6F5_9CORY|nr:hypothetical protein [Corynebacterium felinum]WJY96373.1 hypothetical protein CFELI_14010 [Corynebacterium felinum]
MYADSHFVVFYCAVTPSDGTNNVPHNGTKEKIWGWVGVNLMPKTPIQLPHPLPWKGVGTKKNFVSRSTPQQNLTDKHNTIFASDLRMEVNKHQQW